MKSMQMRFSNLSSRGKIASMPLDLFSHDSYIVYEMSELYGFECTQRGESTGYRRS